MTQIPDPPEPHPTPSPTHQTAAEALAAFCLHNPEAAVSDRDGNFVVSRPWGDSSLSLRVPHGATSLLQALNTLRLPPRLSAIYHLDTNDLEFIYGPVPESESIRRRAFSFHFNKRDLKCEYGDSSARLTALAQAIRLVGPATTTDYRNLASLRSFLRFKRSEPAREEPSPFALTSFWIRNASLPEAELPSLGRHLNFFMHYFDRHTPLILVHEDPGSASTAPAHLAAPRGAFPEAIAGRQLDPYLLALWESAVTATEPSQRFIYNYQVLEYAAFYYLREEIYRAVRRILGAPDIPSRLDEAARQVLDVVADDKTSDDAKIASVFQQCVDPSELWHEIQHCSAFFSASCEFEGGFCLPPLIAANATLEQFRSGWLPKLPDSFRKLRNALVHAREQRMAKCIAPSPRNQRLLRPWASLSSAVAEQVITFGQF